MEKIKCPDCGNEVDSSSNNCPFCGRPMHITTGNAKFVTGSLVSNEVILCSAKWHWINYLFPVFLGVVALFFLILCIVSFGSSNGIGGIYFLLFLVFGIFSVFGFLSTRYNEFVVTNYRIIRKCGIIIRATYELRLEMLESIQVYQGILGRVLGYGHMIVHGVGASRQIVLRLESPYEFRQNIFKDLNK